MDHDKIIFLNYCRKVKVFLDSKFRLMEKNIALISSFDFKADELFDLLGNNTGFITCESLNKFFVENNQDPSI